MNRTKSGANLHILFFVVSMNFLCPKNIVNHWSSKITFTINFNLIITQLASFNRKLPPSNTPFGVLHPWSAKPAIMLLISFENASLLIFVVSPLSQDSGFPPYLSLPTVSPKVKKPIAAFVPNVELPLCDVILVKHRIWQKVSVAPLKLRSDPIPVWPHAVLFLLLFSLAFCILISPLITI